MNLENFVPHPSPMQTHRSNLRDSR